MTQVKQYDFTEAEVSKLFQMQDTLNSYIHPEWKTQGFNWDLAIVDECMEIHGHLGWKWWKKGYQVGLTEENRKQIQLEVIDILHFALSDYLENAVSFIDAAPELNAVFHKWSIQAIIKGIMSCAINGSNMLDTWAALAHSVGLTKPQILETYTQKYVLNKFRQDHGYKTGEYCKEWDVMWGGQEFVWEDNEALAHLAAKLKLGNHDTTDEILLYNELALLYNSRLNKS